MPIEKALQRLPEKWAEVVNVATRKSLETALQAALLTLDDKPQPKPASLCTGSRSRQPARGVVRFGLAGLPFELPLSTTIMLRSIADIARSEGERLRTRTANWPALRCLRSAGRSKSDDASESAYFLMRGALAKSVTEAAGYITERGLVEEGAPALVRFVTQLAARFGVSVSEKVAAQAVPVIGAAGGMAINLMFIAHFQDMARGHFIVRRLERTYGAQLVRTQYERL